MTDASKRPEQKIKRLALTRRTLKTLEVSTKNSRNVRGGAVGPNAPLGSLQGTARGIGC